MQDEAYNYKQFQMKLHEDSFNCQYSSAENQLARAFLRERFLRLMTGLSGKKCELQTVESTKVHGEFCGCDKDIQEFIIHRLKTPLHELESAIVRDRDILSIHIPNICGVIKP